MSKREAKTEPSPAMRRCSELMVALVAALESRGARVDWHAEWKIAEDRYAHRPSVERVDGIPVRASFSTSAEGGEFFHWACGRGVLDGAGALDRLADALIAYSAGRIATERKAAERREWAGRLAAETGLIFNAHPDGVRLWDTLTEGEARAVAKVLEEMRAGENRGRK